MLHKPQSECMTLRFLTNLLILIIFIAPIPVFAGQPLTKAQQEQAAKMSGLYAKHVFNESCFSSHAHFLSKKGVYAVQNDPELSTQLKKGCDCLSEMVVEDGKASLLIQYVQQMSGYMPDSNMANKKRAAYAKTNEFRQIQTIIGNPDNRKKCGFPR